MSIFRASFILLFSCIAIAFASCEAAKKDVSATFDANAATVAHVFADFQAEDDHFFTHFAEDDDSPSEWTGNIVVGRQQWGGPQYDVRNGGGLVTWSTSGTGIYSLDDSLDGSEVHGYTNER